jgi:hypothetical protein
VADGTTLTLPLYAGRFTNLEQAGIERVFISHRHFQQLGFSVLRIYEDIALANALAPHMVP